MVVTLILSSGWFVVGVYSDQHEARSQLLFGLQLVQRPEAVWFRDQRPSVESC